MTEKFTSPKKNVVLPNSRSGVEKNNTLFKTKMTKIHTLFMTKTVEKPYNTLSTTHTYMAHIRACPSANSTHPVAATAVIVKFHYMVQQQT